MSAILTFVSPSTLQYSAVEFDVITGEQHDLSATVSEHPVEEGANIADHVRPDLQRLSLKAFVTDTPINSATELGVSPGSLQGRYLPLTIPGRISKQLTQLNMSGGYPPLTLPGVGISVPTNGFSRPFVPAVVAGSEWGEVDNSVSGYFLQFPTRLARCRGIFQQLEFLCNKGIQVEVATDLRFYERMLITSVSAPRDGTTGIEFTINFRELRTAKTQKTFVKRKAAPAEKRAQTQVPQGKKVAPQTVPDASTVGRVLLDQLGRSGLGKSIAGLFGG